jgi:undecaprenyl-diphosphatase
MSLLTALLLGLIQGLTEFIPISSTAHLTAAAHALGVLDTPDSSARWTAFMATIQLGTLVAVLAYFRTDIMESTRAWFSENLGSRRTPISLQSIEARLGWFVILGSIPIVIVGLLLKPIIEGTLTKSLTVIGFSLIGGALLLWLAERRGKFTRSTSDLTFVDAMIIGAAQCLALFPGNSRSGSTMMAAMFRDMTREHAARFSFLLSIPAILGAGVLQFVGSIDEIQASGEIPALVVATVAGGISGYWSIAFLLKFLRTHSMRPFILYRIAIGAVLLFTACTPQQSEQGAIDLKEMTPPSTTPRTLTDTTDSVAVVITDTVRVVTSKGAFTIGLYGEDAPKAVANFLALVEAKKYNGILVHRVVQDYLIQMGDPTTKDPQLRSEWGKGGQTADGKVLSDELDPLLPSAQRGYSKGVVAMARKQSPNSATSQFFICLEKAATLPYQYTIFGTVLDGMKVVEAIGRMEVEPGPLGETDGIPRSTITIKSIQRR